MLSALCRMRKPWICAYEVLSEIRPVDAKDMAKVMKLPGAADQVITIRTMRIHIIMFGFALVDAVYEDLEGMYHHLVSCLVGKPFDDLADAEDGTTIQESESDEEEAEVRPAAWSGKLLWKDRLRPQDHDDDPADQCIGGLRDASQSLRKLPGDSAEK